MALDDIANALKLYRKAVMARDKEFKVLLKKGWKLSRLADHFKISRQRAHQLAEKIRRVS